MKIADLLELAGNNLRQSKLRNGLTTAGIAVGVASLVAMLSLGIGLQNMANSRLKLSGIFDTVFVTSRQDMRGGGDDSSDQPQNFEEMKTLDDDARAAMTKLPHVIEAQPEIMVMAELRAADKNRAALMAGLPISARDNETFDGMKGKFFSSGEADEAILQKEFAHQIDPMPENLIGKDVTLRYAERQAGSGGMASFSVVRREKTFRVVGLVDGEPFGGMRMISRARIFIPSGTAERLNMMQMADATRAMRGDMERKTYSLLALRVDKMSEIEGVRDAVKKMGFRAYSILDATQSLRRFFTLFDMFLGIFGSLALAVASLAIVNTLVMAVLERRREIGIMKAIGADEADVKKLFFAEAAVMGTIGGALGVVLGWLIGRAINFGTNIYLARHRMPAENLWQVPWWLVFGAILFAAVVSLAAGIYPAARAAKLDPIRALRYE